MKKHDFMNSSLTPKNVFEVLSAMQARQGFNDYILELCLWFVSTLNIKIVKRKEGNIPVSATFLRKICGHDDKDAIRILLEAGMIARTLEPSFIKQLCSEYTINDAFRATKANPMIPRFYRNDIIQNRIIRNYRDKLKENKLNRNLESNFLYKTIIESTTFDWRAAGDYISQTYQESSVEYRIRFETIQYLKEGFIWGHFPKKVNRFFSNYTQLPSDLRRFIVINGVADRKVYFDICNSQIQLFVNDLLTKNKELMDNRDAREFFELVTNPDKDFYTEMINILGIAGTRETIKPFFSQLLYNINTRFTGQVKDASLKTFYQNFASRYPTVMKYLRKIKNNKKACSKFAIALMNTEADFILNRVAKRLNKEKISVITIHDGFLVNQKHEMKAEMIFVEESVKKFGTVLKFKKELV